MKQAQTGFIANKLITYLEVAISQQEAIRS